MNPSKNNKRKNTRGKSRKITPKRKLNQKLLARAVIGSFGIISVIARKCKCQRKTIYDFLKREENKNFKTLFDDMLLNESESALDLSEDKLLASIKKREAWAIKFHLSTKGKNRGYTQKFEFEDKSLNLNTIWSKLQNDKDNPKRMEYLRRLANNEDAKQVLLEYDRLSV